MKEESKWQFRDRKDRYQRKDTALEKVRECPVTAKNKRLLRQEESFIKIFGRTLKEKCIRVVDTNRDLYK